MTISGLSLLAPVSGVQLEIADFIDLLCCFVKDV